MSVVERQLGHAERLDVAADRRQRRHQLVRHVGEQLAARAIGFGQRRRAAVEIGGHAVERARERADLVAAGFGRAHVGASLAERARRLLERRAAGCAPAGKSSSAVTVAPTPSSAERRTRSASARAPAGRPKPAAASTAPRPRPPAPSPCSPRIDESGAESAAGPSAAAARCPAPASGRPAAIRRRRGSCASARARPSIPAAGAVGRFDAAAAVAAAPTRNGW